MAKKFDFRQFTGKAKEFIQRIRSVKLTRKQKIEIAGAAAAMLLIIAGSVLVIIPVLDLVGTDPSGVQDYIEDRGIFGTILFCVLTALQIIAAFMPGGPFQMLAGLMYGVLPGSLIYDTSAACGSMAVYFLSRRFGRKISSYFLSEQEMNGLEKNLKKYPASVIYFIIYLIPGFPKDLLAYTSGMSGIPWWKWFFICFIGRFPTILLSASGGSELGEQNYLIFLLIAALIYVSGKMGQYLYRKFNSSSDKDTDPETMASDESGSKTGSE